MPKPHDITNQRFGRLVAIRFIGIVNHNAMWECQCDCGKTTMVSRSNLVRTKSCGCLHRETAIAHGRNNRKHGHSKPRTRVYMAWSGMISRCYNSASPSFKDYGGRGIAVCRRWRNSFENFFTDMGEPPQGYSIERKNNNLGYSPENCVWATTSEQNNNTRGNHLLTYQGQTLTVAQWTAKLGYNPTVIHSRLAKKWTTEEILTTPPRKSPLRRSRT